MTFFWKTFCQYIFWEIVAEEISFNALFYLDWGWDPWLALYANNIDIVDGIAAFSAFERQPIKMDLTVNVDKTKCKLLTSRVTWHIGSQIAVDNTFGIFCEFIYAGSVFINKIDVSMTLANRCDYALNRQLPPLYDEGVSYGAEAWRLNRIQEKSPT